MVAVGEMAAVREVKTHDAVVDVADGGVGVEVGGGAGES